MNADGKLLVAAVPADPFPLVGASAPLEALKNELRYAIGSDAKVLLTGESGVGKEVVAQLIHRHSGRARAQLVTINCAGVPDTLLESELFGHARGSFTDAHRDRKGWLEQAHGGTVFLDELGEMSLRMQAVLLRFLETGEIQRVGSERPSTIVNVRLICATNVRLLDRVRAGLFREDLYYRVNVIHIHIPPLRQRPEDVPLLVDHFMGLFSRLHKRPVPQLSQAALDMLKRYDWPGNVRELRNVVERVVLRADTAVVEPGHFPPEIARPGPELPAAAVPQPAAPHTAQILFDRIVRNGESFWTVVYAPFMARDLRREEMRELIAAGLTHTQGNYKSLVRLFRMQPDDYKRFLNFLRKYECHMPFQNFRTAPPLKATSESLWHREQTAPRRRTGSD